MLRLEDLSVGFPNHPLLKSLNLTVPSGSVVILLGRNGAGKTTLLKTLSGLHPPLEGQVHLSENARRIFLPSQHSVADALTGEDIEAIYGRSSKDWPIPSWSPSKKASFSRLSSGEQRQVLLSATLASDADIVILDEPFNFLDWAHTLELIEVISAHSKQGRTFLLTTHLLDWALRIPNSLTWAIVDTTENFTRKIITGTTHEVLSNPTFQTSFGVHIQLVKGPNESGHLLHITR